MSLEPFINLLVQIKNNFTKSHVLSIRVINKLKEFGWVDINPLENEDVSSAYKRLKMSSRSCNKILNIIGNNINNIILEPDDPLLSATTLNNYKLSESLKMLIKENYNGTYFDSSLFKKIWANNEYKKRSKHINELTFSHDFMESYMDFLIDDNGGDQEIEDPLSEFTTEEIKETIDKYVTTVAGLKRSITLYREIIYKVASDPDILEFAPHMIAYQLTLIDSAIFLEIDPHSLLAHSTKNPDPKIIASTDFFNYLTRIVECSILSPVEASSRALVIHHWVKVAAKLHELHNFQTLKAILSALGTPPIKRLKRTWTCIPKKSMVKLDSLNEMMSESSNYEKYRETIQPEIFSRKPIVPFLGTFIMDATYLSAAIRNSASSSINSPLISLSMTSTTTNSDDSDSGNGNKNNNITGNSCFTHPISRSMSLPSSPEKILTLQDDSRVQELLHTMFRYQNGPKYQPIPPMSYIKASTKHHFRATSLGAALHRGSVIRYHNRNDDDNEIIKEKQQIITHYLLTRTWIPEKSVDELSLQREPHKQKSSQDATV
ncbi:21900_t:CDS:2 [Entrophospora sp. SA101]|nr:21900_t:CDS:2 [Entrophospora sp. SA101]